MGAGKKIKRKIRRQTKKGAKRKAAETALIWLKDQGKVEVDLSRGTFEENSMFKVPGASSKPKKAKACRHIN